MSEAPEPFGEALTYADNIALSWRAVNHTLDDNHLARVNASNEGFLRGVSVLREVGNPLDAPKAEPGQSQDVMHLELKVNLLIDLVSTLIYHQLDIPETQRVMISSRGVAWEGEVPPPGSVVYLQLYIQRGLPKPLCCYGKVVSSEEDFAAGRARAEFMGLTGTAQDWLEKLIFRHHRAEVAYQRSHRDD